MNTNEREGGASARDGARRPAGPGTHDVMAVRDVRAVWNAVEEYRDGT